MAILTFCYTVLLWSMRTQRLMYQPMLVKILLELSTHVFTVIIKADSKFGKKLGLNHCVKRTKDSKNLIFVFQQVEPRHLSAIINKENKPTITR